MGLIFFAIYKVLSQSPKSCAIFTGESYEQVACSRDSHFLKKLIWVTSNWPAGPQQNRRVRVWTKFLRNNDLTWFESSQIHLEISKPYEIHFEATNSQSCVHCGSPPNRRNAWQIGAATVNPPMAVTAVQLLATIMRRLAAADLDPRELQHTARDTLW